MAHAPHSFRAINVFIQHTRYEIVFVLRWELVAMCSIHPYIQLRPLLLTHQQLGKLDLVSLSLEYFVFSTTSVRDLRAILNQKLVFIDQITALSRSCFSFISCELSPALSLTSSSSPSSIATMVHAPLLILSSLITAFRIWTVDSGQLEAAWGPFQV